MLTGLVVLGARALALLPAPGQTSPAFFETIVDLNRRSVSMGTDDEPPGSAADTQADTAVQRLEAAKAAVGKVLDSRCSDPAGWDRWVNDVVSAVAAVVGIADIDGALKKNGASPDKLQRFAQAKGDDVTQLQAAAAVRRKIDTCAAATGRTAPSTDQLVQSVYTRANAVKRHEEGALGLEKLYRPIKRPGV